MSTLYVNALWKSEEDFNNDANRPADAVWGENVFSSYNSAFAVAQDGDTIRVTGEIGYAYNTEIGSIANPALDVNVVYDKAEVNNKGGQYRIDNGSTATLIGGSTLQTADTPIRGILNIGSEDGATATVTMEAFNLYGEDNAEDCGGKDPVNTAVINVYAGSKLTINAASNENYYIGKNATRNGLLNIDGGSVDATYLKVNAGSAVNISDGGSFTVQKTLTNNGTIKVTGEKASTVKAKITGNALQLENGVLEDSEITGDVMVTGDSKLVGKNTFAGSEAVVKVSGGTLEIGETASFDVELSTDPTNIKGEEVYLPVNGSVYLQAGDDNDYWSGHAGLENKGAGTIDVYGSLAASQINANNGGIVNVYENAEVKTDIICVENGSIANDKKGAMNIDGDVMTRIMNIFNGGVVTVKGFLGVNHAGNNAPSNRLNVYDNGQLLVNGGEVWVGEWAKVNVGETGSITLTNGSFTSDVEVSNNGTFTVGGASELNGTFTGKSVKFEDGTVLTSSNGVTFKNKVNASNNMTFGAGYVTADGMELSNDSVVFDKDANVTVGGTFATYNASNVKINSGAEVAATSIYINGGDVEIDGKLATLSGPDGGFIMNGKGTVTVNKGGVLDLVYTDAYYTTGNMTVDVYGTAKVSFKLSDGSSKFTWNIYDGGSLTAEKHGIVLNNAESAINIYGNATAKSISNNGTITVDGGELIVNGTLTNNGDFTVKGTSTLDIDSLTGNITVLDTTVIKGSTVGGTGSLVIGEGGYNAAVTFKGDNEIGKIVAFSGSKVIVGADGSLHLTGARSVFGNGATWDIDGNIENAKAVTDEQKADLKVSLDLAQGLSMSTTNGAASVMNIDNAYVVIGNKNGVTSKNTNSAGGSFDINVTNSIIDASSNFAVFEPTVENSPVYDIDFKDSVLNFKSNLLNADKGSSMTFDNSKVTVNSSFRNDGTFELLNKSEMVVNNYIQESSGNAGMYGSVRIDNSELTIKNSTEGHKTINRGSIDLANGATFVADYVENFGDETSKATISVANSTLDIANLTNNGEITVGKGTNTLVIDKLTGNALQIVDGATVNNSTIGGAVEIVSGTNNWTGTNTVSGVFSVGYNMETEDTTTNITGAFTNTNFLTSRWDREATTTVNIGSKDADRTTFNGGQFGIFENSVINIANADVTYNYSWMRGDVNISDSIVKNTSINTYVSAGGVVTVDNSTWDAGSYVTFGSYGAAVATGSADVTLQNNAIMNVTNFNLSADEGTDYTVKMTVDDATLNATKFDIGAGAELEIKGGKVDADVLSNDGTIIINVDDENRNAVATLIYANKGANFGSIVVDETDAAAGVDYYIDEEKGDVIVYNKNLATTVTFNSAWTDYSIGQEIGEGSGLYFGINAFNKFDTSGVNNDKKWTNLLVLPEATTEIVLVAGNSDENSYGMLRPTQTVTVKTEGEGYAVIDRFVNVIGNLTFAEGSMVKVLGQKGLSGANNQGTETGEQSYITINGTVYFANAAAPKDNKALYCWGLSSTPGYILVNSTGKLITEAGNVESRGTIEVKGYMELGSAGDAPKLNGVGGTDIANGHLIVDGIDGAGKLVVKHHQLNFGGGDRGTNNPEYGQDWWDAAEGSTVTIKNGGVIETAAVTFRNGKNNTLTLDNGSLIFNNGSDYGVDHSDITSKYFDNMGVISASNNSTIDLADREFINDGSMTIDSSDLTADTLVNNNDITLKGTATFDVEDFDNNATLTLNGFNGTLTGVTKLEDEAVTGNIEVYGKTVIKDSFDTALLSVGAKLTESTLGSDSLTIADGVTANMANLYVKASSSMNIAADAVINVIGFYNKTDSFGGDGLFASYGTTNVDGTLNVSNNAGCGYNKIGYTSYANENGVAVVNVNDGGVFNLNTVGGDGATNSLVIDTDGTLNVNNGGTFNADDRATVVNNGIFQVSGSSTVNADITGNVTLKENATLNGKLSADTVTIEKNAVLGEKATLDAVINGGKLAVSGNANTLIVGANSTGALSADGATFTYGDDVIGDIAITGNGGEFTADEALFNGNSISGIKLNVTNEDGNGIINVNTGLDNINSVNGNEVKNFDGVYYFTEEVTNDNGTPDDTSDDVISSVTNILSKDENGISYAAQGSGDGDGSVVGEKEFGNIVIDNKTGDSINPDLDVVMKKGTTTIKVGKGKEFAIGSIAKNENGGKTDLDFADSSDATINGYVDSFGNLTVGKDADFDITGALNGKNINQNIKIGAGSTADFSDVDMMGGKNTFSVAAGATVNTGKLDAVTTLSLANGKADDLTEMTVDGKYTAAAANNSVKLGNYAKLTVTGDFTNGGVESGTGTTFKAGNYSKIIVENVDGLAGLTIGKESTFDSASISGTENSNKINIGADSDLIVDGAINLKDGKNSITLGKEAGLTAASIANVQTITLAADATATIVGDVNDLQKLTIGKDADFNAANLYGTEANDKITVSGELNLSGNLDLGSGKNTIALNKDAELGAASIANVQTITLAADADLTAASINGVQKLTLGKAATLDVDAVLDGVQKFTAGNESEVYLPGLNGTEKNDAFTFGNDSTIGSETEKVAFNAYAGNDSIKIGNNAIAHIASIDLGDGKDTVTLGKDSKIFVDEITNVETINASKGSQIITRSDVNFDAVGGSWKNATIMDVDNILTANAGAGAVYGNEWDLYDLAAGTTSVMIADETNSNTIYKVYEKGVWDKAVGEITSIDIQFIGNLDASKNYVLAVSVEGADFKNKEDEANKYSFTLA